MYLSPKPRTYTYFPPCTETPGTDLTAEAMLDAPEDFILCDESPSTRLTDFFWNSRTDLSVFVLALTLTTTSSNPWAKVFKVTFTIAASFNVTLTSLTSTVS